MMRNRRRSGDEAYPTAVSGVAAYLADEDADVYNITDAAVRLDGLAYALNLTALAATAITALAGATGRTPMEVLRSMEPEGRNLGR
ncbi:hypothetical protein SAMN05443287_12040 [Micromonospora phaseoli]|uniref:Uncharacterized protein n=1 Tax=Micromonospora phaseoli TaxID=1144548 RepID=A0A1H7DZG9_9ACTN|nr:hypothetical protein CLV64_12114 [Micromonospora phaseoli]SEK06227.1 hypothetical protein SAMN05443287_12040 [Micromonospora phaseoli]